MTDLARNYNARREFIHKKMIGKTVEVVKLGTDYIKPHLDPRKPMWCPIPEYGIAIRFYPDETDPPNELLDPIG